MQLLPRWMPPPPGLNPERTNSPARKGGNSACLQVIQKNGEREGEGTDFSELRPECSTGARRERTIHPHRDRQERL